MNPLTISEKHRQVFELYRVLRRVHEPDWRSDSVIWVSAVRTELDRPIHSSWVG